MSDVADGCLACGQRLVEGPRHGWLRCAGCRSWRRDRMPSPEELHAAHERLYFAGDDTHDMTAMALLDQYVEAFDRSVDLAGKRVLDIGAGTADVAALVSRRGADYSAVEASDTARAVLAERGWPAYASPSDASVEPPFDAALLIELVEHLLDPTAFLRDVRACLRPGGHLYVATPNAASLHGALKGGRWWAAALEAHVVLFTARGLGELLSTAGFEVVHRHRRVDYGGAAWHRAAQSILQLGGGDGGLRVIARAV